MIKIIFAALIIILFPALTIYSHDGIGIGIIVGEPTGISVKKWLNEKYAFDGAAAWSFADNSSFQFHADYLIHNRTIMDTGDASGKIPLYFGFGGRIKLKGSDDKDLLAGLRVPLGISYLFAENPVDVFLEVVPLLDLIPATRFGINAAIGARYYIK